MKFKRVVIETIVWEETVEADSKLAAFQLISHPRTSIAFGRHLPDAKLLFKTSVVDDKSVQPGQVDKPW